MPDPDVLAAVWGETSRATPKDGSQAAAARLDAVVAKLAAVAKTRGLDSRLRRLEPPRIGSPQAAQYQAMAAIADAVENGTWSGVALPARAALWEVTVGGSPRLNPALPKTLGWITDQDVATGGDFVLDDGADGRVFRLFESAKVSDEAELPFASALTGSGLPEPDRANPYGKLAWRIGIAAALFFLLGGALSVWTGRSMSNAHNLLVTAEPKLQYDLLAAVTNICATDAKAFPSGAQSAVCGQLLPVGKVPAKVDDLYVLPNAGQALALASACQAAAGQDGCNAIWRAAIDVEQKNSWLQGTFQLLHRLSAYLTGVGAVAGSASILVPFLLLVAGIAGLTIALGLGTKQRVAGVWIDTRNRVSLARAQVTLWTATALAGYAAFALFNVGFSGIAGDAAGIAGFAAFPAIPTSVAAALGIAAASPMLSALILPLKEDSGKKVDISIRGNTGDLRARGAPFFGAESEGLDKRLSPQQASIADIFMGEEKANAETVDVSRLQNVVITVTLVLGFFSYLIAQTTVGATQLIGAKSAIFTTLPELGATFTSLLLASHTTYLISKAHDARDTTTTDQPRDAGERPERR